MKTALIAIIRNEAHDILPWLAWHARLGIDSFFLFDDSSDDGTRDILQAAATLHDIRLFQMTACHGSFTERQRQVYCDCLENLRSGSGDEYFDWVGFLDADEYLSLHHHHHIASFLGTFPGNIGAVGIHWCLYGSNGQVLRPDMPAFYSFTRHGAPDHQANRHIKTFIRPQAWNGEWVNPHYFPLAEGDYAHADGGPLIWGELQGLTEAEAGWDTARIMHFQNRSLEQFIERVRKRSDKDFTLEDFHQHDLNDKADTRARGLLPDCLSWMRDVVFQGAAKALTALPDSGATQKLDAVQPSSLLDKLHQAFDKQEKQGASLLFSWLIPWTDDNLEIHGGWACPQKLSKNNSALFTVQVGARPEQVFLFALSKTGKILDFSVLDDRRLTSFLRYRLYPSGQQGRFALRKSYGEYVQTHGFMTTIPNEPLVANRKEAYLWEFFRLAPAPTARDDLHWEDIPLTSFLIQAFHKPITLERIAELSHQDRHLTLYLLPLFYAALPENEQIHLRILLGAFASYIL